MPNVYHIYSYRTTAGSCCHARVIRPIISQLVLLDYDQNISAALKFCFKTCVPMKFVDDDDDD